MSVKEQLTHLVERYFDKPVLFVEELLGANPDYWQAEAITQKTVDLARSGDTVALRLCLERICPARKSRPVNITLPGVITAEGVTEAKATMWKQLPVINSRQRKALPLAASWKLGEKLSKL